MNIFVLDESPVLSAQMHCDKHCVKMILETAQLLCTAVRLHGVEYGYKATHINHPCAIWARASKGNFLWLKSLGQELCREYTHRYNKTHKSESIITNVPEDCIPDGRMTSFVLAMPDQYKIPGDAVESYRAYYRGKKQSLLVYTNRDVPNWIADIGRKKV